MMLDIIPNVRPLREAAGEGEQVLHAVKLAERTGHEELIAHPFAGQSTC